MSSTNKGVAIEAVDLDRPHVPLATFRVLYIGRAAPKATLDSIEAIQKPLCELYTKDDCQSRITDVDAILTVYTSGLLMEPINPLDNDLWLPIQTLQSSAAVKAVVEDLPGCTDHGKLSFVPIDAPLAASSPYPPIFSCMMGRTNGLPLTDCYAFLCQSNDSALVVVQATMQAFSNRKGWAVERPPKKSLRSAEQCRSKEQIIIGEVDDTPAEFYEKPPLSGFFYTPRSDLIQKYHIKSEGCATETRSSFVQERTPYIPEGRMRSTTISTGTAPNVTTTTTPVVGVVFDTEQDMIFMDEGVRVSDVDRWPQIPTAATTKMIKVAQPGESQAIAFNPYLVPSLDPPPPSAQQIAVAPIAKAMTPIVPKDPVVITPVVQQLVSGAPAHFEESIYHKRLPRSTAGFDQTYVNQSNAADGIRLHGAQGYPRWDDNPPAPSRYVQKPVEELYSHRLPQPVQEPLPQGALQFDANFILQQSDTDRARSADEGYHKTTPAPFDLAEVY